ncbi:MAG: hypothetical protein MJ248_04875, partial [Bacilli bacterium]|nr:hypothetical protein [Bacilli bacterium]
MKAHKIPLLLLSLTMLAGCGPQNGGSSDTTTSNNNDESGEKYETEEDKMYQKLWEAKTIFNESCVMIEGADGVKSARLVYRPTEIIEVRNATLQKVYSKDEYRIEGDRIIMTEESTMPFLTQANVAATDIPDSIGGKHESDKVPSGNILFTEGVGIIMYQIAVTYKTNDNWYGTIPQRKGERLPKLQEKLANHEDITFV